MTTWGSPGMQRPLVKTRGWVSCTWFVDYVYVRTHACLYVHACINALGARPKHRNMEIRWNTPYINAAQAQVLATDSSNEASEFKMLPNSLATFHHTLNVLLCILASKAPNEALRRMFKYNFIFSFQAGARPEDTKQVSNKRKVSSQTHKQHSLPCAIACKQSCNRFNGEPTAPGLLSHKGNLGQPARKSRLVRIFSTYFRKAVPFLGSNGFKEKL